MTRFALGSIVCTPGIQDLVKRYPVNLATLLVRHATGDWGDVCAADHAENDFSVRAGFRVMSVYRHHDPDWTVWVITEADRSCTTFLLPEEY